MIWDLKLRVALAYSLMFQTLHALKGWRVETHERVISGLEVLCQEWQQAHKHCHATAALVTDLDLQPGRSPWYMKLQPDSSQLAHIQENRTSYLQTGSDDATITWCQCLHLAAANGQTCCTIFKATAKQVWQRTLDISPTIEEDEHAQSMQQLSSLSCLGISYTGTRD